MTIKHVAEVDRAALPVGQPPIVEHIAEIDRAIEIARETSATLSK